jgi:CheY-like chemotaxis protein
LVIDDNLDTQDLLRENLLDAGYQVITAPNGEEGLQRAREVKPYAITLDIMMPRKDGWQVLHELKTDPSTQDIPVILLSIVDQKDMGFRLGAFDYLVKPVEEGALVAALDRLTHTAVPGTTLDLLVVDDDPNIANLVAQFLDQDKYHVRTAEDGLSGLQAVNGQTPDAILLDLMMPRLNGFEFISQLRQDPRYKNLPIIVLTARSLTEADLENLADSAAKVLYKNGMQQEKLFHELFEALENMADIEE